ncbi:unnamed protein product [Cuscuta campestris]|uniref:Chromo domain-containing protein n=1 Tax=Cuscuta campestris TaxID=132261 RepID=A0A484L738_9ASTE|nr:unnamed protein product [Cuscuta campestris]
MLIDHPASEWFHYYMANNFGVSWDAFLLAVQQWFDPHYYENYIGLLSKLTQTTSVLEYQTAFESLLNKVSGVPEPTLVSMFVAGLRQPIQREVNLRNPTSLPAAFALARELSACHAEAAATYTQAPHRQWPPRPPPPSPTSAGLLPTPGSGSASTAPPPRPPDKSPLSRLPVVRVTNAEKIERSKKGLCWYCDEKWDASHNCRRRFLVLMGPEDDDDASAITSPPPDEDDTPLLSGDISSILSLAGSPSPRSIKVAGSVHNNVVQVLLDSGSTHNFIHPSVAERLALVLHPVTPFRVYVGNGDSLRCSYSCPQTPLLLQGNLFRIDLYLLEIHGSDIVFGVQWLQMLGKDIQHENTTTNDLLELHAAITVGTGPPHFSVHHGLLYFKRRLVLSAASPIRQQLLHEYHATPLAGHQGVERTFRRLADGFYWPNMRGDVCRFVASCEVCQTTKYSTRKPAGLLQPLPILDQVWESASMDFITGLLLSRGFLVIMVVVDRLTKYAHFGTLATGFDAPKVAQLFLDVVANRHRRDLSFNVGDMVLLRLHPYRQHSLARPVSVKLARRYYGPFEILERIGEVAYRLRLPEGCHIHDVFHVSLLKLFVPRDSLPPPTPIPAAFYKGRPLSVPVAAVDSRTVLVDGLAQEQWLVRWSDGSDADATWEPLEDLLRHFPDLRLEDKAIPNPGGVDTVLNPVVSPEDEDHNPFVSAAPGRPKRVVRPPRKYQDYV